MARKRHKPEEIVGKLRQADVLHSQGMSMADAIRQLGISEVTFYRWRREYGGMSGDQLRRLKDLWCQRVLHIQASISPRCCERCLTRCGARLDIQCARGVSSRSSHF